MDKLKSSAKSIASGGGAKNYMGQIFAILFGALMGVIVNFVLSYIFSIIVYPATDKKGTDGNYSDPVGMHTLYIDGVSVYPFQNVNGQYYMYYNELIEVLSTIALLVTKKYWFVIGYFAGWYSAGYFGLYRMLKLPIGARDVPYTVATT